MNASYLNYSVKSIGLPTRTTNALIKNGVKTVQDLLISNDLDLLSKKGLGQTSIEAINRFLETIEVIPKEQDHSDESFGEYFRVIQKNPRSIQIFAEYYNGGPKVTLEQLGDKYGLTRERIRQIIKKNLSKIKLGYESGIMTDLDFTLEQAADQKTEISLINIKDDIFTSAGIARFIVDINPKKYKIITDPNLNGEWFTKTEDNVQEMLSILIDELKYKSEPLYLPNIKNIYSIPEDMVMSLTQIIEKEGYVTYESNKLATGTDRHCQLENYFNYINRPASVSEIAANTNLTENQVRGGLQNKKWYINIGKSIYDLADRKYEDSTICDLATKIITAENKALKLDRIVEYVQRYYSASENEICNNLLSSDNIKHIGDYFLLTNWGEDKIERKKRVTYSVMLYDAIFDIISSSKDILNSEDVKKIIATKYREGEVSMNENSIKATLIHLANDGMITRIGKNTGYYTANNNLASNNLNMKAIIGSEYTNSDIMQIFHVSGQGGIRKSIKDNCLVIIAKHDESNPYDDKWVDGILHYTGMGQEGDQSVDYKQNKDLAESNENGLDLYLFESYESNSYFYRGKVKLDGEPYFETQKDIFGRDRQVVKFRLKKCF